jgi:hypothetical protein
LNKIKQFRIPNNRLDSSGSGRCVTLSALVQQIVNDKIRTVENGAIHRFCLRNA